MSNALNSRGTCRLAQTDVYARLGRAIRGLFPVVIASGIVLSALSAHTQEYCLSPVESGEPKLAVEEEQPYRIAAYPRIVPGFSGLVVQALNRHELYEFDGKRLTLIEDDFPHVWGFADRIGIHNAPDGHSYGFGYRPKVIFHHRNGSPRWEPIEHTRGYWAALFDQGSGAVHFMLSKSDDVLIIEGGQVTGRSVLPFHDGLRTKSIRTVPEIGVTLALTGPMSNKPTEGAAIWFREPDDLWQRVELPEGHRLLDRFHGAKIEIVDDLLRIFPAKSIFDPIFLRIRPGSLIYAGSAPSGVWTYHSASRTWIGWNGRRVQPRVERRFVFWEVDVEPTPLKAFILAPGAVEAQIIPGLSPPSDIWGSKTFFSPQTVVLDGNMPALVSAENGLAAISRENFEMQRGLLYERIGRLPKVWSSGGRNFIQSQKGIFLLDDDLSARRIENFPIEEPRLSQTSINYIDAWKAYVIVDRASGKVFLSPDLQDFVEIASTEQIASFVGLSPEPASVLLVGETRLHALAKCEG